MKNYAINHEQQTVDLLDGEDPVEYWWEDMRPKEVLRLVEEVYQRAYKKGLDSGEEKARRLLSIFRG